MHGLVLLLMPFGLAPCSVSRLFPPSVHALGGLVLLLFVPSSHAACGLVLLLVVFPCRLGFCRVLLAVLVFSCFVFACLACLLCFLVLFGLALFCFFCSFFALRRRAVGGRRWAVVAAWFGLAVLRCGRSAVGVGCGGGLARRLASGGLWFGLAVVSGWLWWFGLVVCCWLVCCFGACARVGGCSWCWPCWPVGFLGLLLGLVRLLWMVTLVTLWLHILEGRVNPMLPALIIVHSLNAEWTCPDVMGLQAC